jgi:hypothetical protein
MRRLTTLAVLALVPTVATAQGLRSAPSGRATTEVTLSPPRVQGQPAPAAVKIRIDYGVPALRGRPVYGPLVPLDAVWRTGANAATTLTTDVDLMLGALRVPKGSYTLFTFAKQGSAQLAVSKKTGQWGTEYDPAQDLGRLDLTVTTLASPVEAFTMWLIPAGDGAPSGEFRMAWGNQQWSAPWRVAP